MNDIDDYKLKRQLGCKNITVSELIEELQSCDPDAIVCTVDTPNPYPNGFVNSTIELINEYANARYLDDDGNEQRGKIISIQ